MKIVFEKYHGAGNDFIMVDARSINEHLFSNEIVATLCDRHFGIGADGLILLLGDRATDFRMKYFNADGREGTMCGNGGRCITAFARSLGIIKEKAVFTGIDGLHDAWYSSDGLIHLKMNMAKDLQRLEDGFLIDTGSPHLVLFRNDIAGIDVYHEGRSLRYNERFMPGGVNVNFVEPAGDGHFRIRTYERGVENETLACGTGSVASAIAASERFGQGITQWKISAPGGELEVAFKKEGDNYSDIWLTGKAEKVFSGEIHL
ncbi:MAG: diaminopimelate epimerase [Bacteroidota bacterium]